LPLVCLDISFYELPPALASGKELKRQKALAELEEKQFSLWL
jgi:hypothetical protein